ncbi:hypothetical protein SLNWT_4110 [Streptomyces albus]|uniref:Uncharacterized protein n=1 Tax=Streptomyces albus (strain ATCC 21838 / DSM 41398 / FERM P-419 / JCM 4703 / NBRC 107858) TaxID=1081613 RepID=A0A0B5F0T7_STRA4|nr:hypothetical protein SLNWT_4110 [Streptomyces albus]AOU78796.1 hypothetical protein SLNHY_4105 [Streptomyces albus]AYN34530.1 hypothetical protein DUI70_4031 [Streptomyces albus]
MIPPTREAPVPYAGPGAYSARLVAHTLRRPRVLLGEHRGDSPQLALRWLLRRAQDVADQLATPYAHPVRAWTADRDEHTWALGYLTLGEPYVFWAADEDGTRYVFSTQRTAVPQPPSATRKFPSARTVRGRGFLRLVRIPGRTGACTGAETQRR